MNLKDFLKKEVQEFITQNLKTDPVKLILKGSPFSEIEIKKLVEQIQAKKKAEKKLPTWFKSNKVVYPPLLNLSQSSSEKTAEYKANLISGKSLIDITGGFGVDDFYFSQKVDKVIHCELNPSLSAIARHNFQQLSNQQNCDFIIGDGIDFLNNYTKKADWIYADPGRRSALGKKIFRLEETQPNVVKHLSLLQEKAKNILLKTSPLLDISQGIQQLKTVKEIHIVAVKNEVKELLWILTDKKPKEIQIHTINFDTFKNQQYTAFLAAENQQEITYSTPLAYLYEPNSAILKAGFFKNMAVEFKLYKIAKHTHLYTSDELVDFPGRVFKVINILPVHKKHLQKTGIKKANISTRNFPLKPAQIKKKFKLKDGGKTYLFFTENHLKEKIIIQTIKQNQENQ